MAFCAAFIFSGAFVPVFAADRTEPLNREERALHALNRLAFGPRPGDVERVSEMGVETWIRQQLQPERIPNAAAESYLANFEGIQKSQAQLIGAYRDALRERREIQTRAAQAAANGTPQMRERPVNFEAAEALGELQHAKIARAVLSERQLEEVLVDFWFNHFNVDVRKQTVGASVIAYERDVIRPNLFGSFRDLLGATAKSASMLVYLDNWQSTQEGGSNPAGQRLVQRAMEQSGLSEEQIQQVQQRRGRGINENYARELMELHTLGVDAGYTQRDVQEVARILTGWTIDPRTGEFVFRQAAHDPGPKTVLGRTFPGNGQQDGERLLDMLASHPATARRIAYKLCQRFVADDPPEALVSNVARVFTRTNGNLRRTYEALFLDPIFFAPENFGSKIKSPFDFAVSAIRATGGDFREPRGIGLGPIPMRAAESGAALGRGGDRVARMERKTVLIHIADMGQQLYAWGPPTGFPEESSHWVSAGALISRLNYAIALTTDQVPDVRVDVASLIGRGEPESREALVDLLAHRVLGRGASPATREVILREPEANARTAADHASRILALLLGSPEFQRR